MHLKYWLYFKNPKLPFYLAIYTALILKATFWDKYYYIFFINEKSGSESLKNSLPYFTVVEKVPGKSLVKSYLSESLKNRFMEFDKICMVE